jgi:hypothetical protein
MLIAGAFLNRAISRITETEGRSSSGHERRAPEGMVIKERGEISCSVNPESWATNRYDQS